MLVKLAVGMFVCRVLCFTSFFLLFLFLKSAGCPNQKSCVSGANKEVDPALEHIQDRLSAVKHIILVLSGKGGVG
jgi:hypothetical protein